MFIYKYKISLADTDAAGVMFFANQFRIIHCAYEAYLESIDYSVSKILSEKEFALPIFHAESDFIAPIKVGDFLEIRLVPGVLGSTTFSIDYEIYNAGNLCGVAKTIHIAIDPATGKKRNLPELFVIKLREME